MVNFQSAATYLEVDDGCVPAMCGGAKRAEETKVLPCSHGGDDVVGAIYRRRKLFCCIAKTVVRRTMIVHYGRLPENPLPGPVNDMVKAYRWQLETQGFKPGDIAFTGDSAGDTLAVTTFDAAREQGRPMPAACISMSPWAGADTSGESCDTNAHRDALVSRALQGAGRTTPVGRERRPRGAARPCCTPTNEARSRFAQAATRPTGRSARKSPPTLYEGFVMS